MAMTDGRVCGRNGTKPDWLALASWVVSATDRASRPCAVDGAGGRRLKRFASPGGSSVSEQRRVQAQQHRAAVDPARERHTNGGTSILGYEPAAHLVVQR